MSNLSLTKLQKYAYDFIKDMILSGKFLENEIYSETKLSKEIGISRTPMRESLQRLSQEGFIDILPSKGFRLHKFSEKEIIEIFQIRSAIEGYATFLLTHQCKTAKGIETIDLLKG
uniref:GntR family transcriptional regulator n=1 Tax=Terrisporobacter sp. TaxID=1965305 RepID=UPI002618EAF5